MVNSEDVKQADRRADELSATIPHAVSARYDARLKRVLVQLSSGLGVLISPAGAQGLEHASGEQLSTIEISPSGFGLHFPKLDADLYLPSIFAGLFGSLSWTATRQGSPRSRLQTAAKLQKAAGGGSRPRRLGVASVPCAAGALPSGKKKLRVQ